MTTETRQERRKGIYIGSFLAPPDPISTCILLCVLADDILGLQEPHSLWLLWARLLGVDSRRLESGQSKSRYLPPSPPFLSRGVGRGCILLPENRATLWRPSPTTTVSPGPSNYTLLQYRQTSLYYAVLSSSLQIIVVFTNWRFVATLHQASLVGPFFQRHFLTSYVTYW